MTEQTKTRVLCVAIGFVAMYLLAGAFGDEEPTNKYIDTYDRQYEAHRENEEQCFTPWC